MGGRAKKPAAPRKKANGYKMPPPLPNGEVIIDTIGKKKWRLGPSIGVGGFGEIYSACDHEAPPKKGSNYPFVIKIEPHENGPLFVEKHFYLRNANKDDISNFMKSKKLPSLGMPSHYGGGSHEYKGEKYRYLVLERYGKDLWSIFLENGRSFPAGTVFQIGLQMLDVLEYIHSRGYVHADLKGANILLGMKKGTENQAYLVDFGLANRVNEKEFKPEPKCAHDGTIEYTSRDAHLGVSTMRGDLEILGYNMLQWLIGELPWEKNLKDPKAVQAAKEAFMKNVKGSVTKLKGYVPDALVKFFEYINTLKPKEIPNHTKCRQIFETYLKSEGITRSSQLLFSSSKGKPSKTTKNSNTSLTDGASDISKPNGVSKVTKRGRPPKSQTNSDNDTPDDQTSTEVKIKKFVKRKSTEPAVVVIKKKTKLAPKLTPKATPPVKKDHVNISTQTSVEKLKKDPRQVSFDSPISEVLGERRSMRSINSSGDIFDDSFVIEERKIKKKKRVSDEDYIIKKVVKKKVTIKTKAKPKTKSWKDAATIVNGRAPRSS